MQVQEQPKSLELLLVFLGLLLKNGIVEASFNFGKEFLLNECGVGAPRGALLEELIQHAVEVLLQLSRFHLGCHALLFLDLLHGLAVLVATGPSLLSAAVI